MSDEQVASAKIETAKVAILENKAFRLALDIELDSLKRGKASQTRKSRERSLAITKIEEAIMWLGMDLKALNEEFPGIQDNPYPESKNPHNYKIEPTADGLKM